MSKAYARGFCKAAAVAGVNPVILAKIAADNGILDYITDTYKNMDPLVRRALLSGIATGAGTYILSNPYNPNRFLNSLTGGALGGLGMYALDRSGGTDALVDFIRDNVTKLRPRRRTMLGETLQDSKRALS